MIDNKVHFDPIQLSSRSESMKGISWNRLELKYPVLYRVYGTIPLGSGMTFDKLHVMRLGKFKLFVDDQITCSGTWE